MRSKLIHAWRRRIITVSACAATLMIIVCASCDSSRGDAADRESQSLKRAGASTRVFVSILPQADFVKRIAGDRVEVEVMVGPGQSHHTYEPTPRQISRLVESKAFFRIGVPFERAVCDRVARAAPSLAVVDTSRGVTFLEMSGCCADHERPPTPSSEPTDAEHGDHHDHAGRDPHIWLSPKLVRIQAGNIRDELVRLDPAHAAKYDRGLAAFDAELTQLNNRIAARLAPFRGRPFFVFHPAYGYFADAYGLEQLAVEEDGKEPSARRLVELIDRAKSLGVKRIYVQPQFAVGGAGTVAKAIGAEVVPLDPMTVDYVRDLWVMAERIAEGFEMQGTQVPEK